MSERNFAVEFENFMSILLSKFQVTMPLFKSRLFHLATACSRFSRILVRDWDLIGILKSSFFVHISSILL